MLLLTRFAVFALALFGVADAAPSLVSIASRKGSTRPGGYIVTLKEHAVARRSVSTVQRSILNSFSASDAQIKYEWPNLNAFAGTFSDAALLALRSSGDVAAIEHDTIGGVSALVTQRDAPWGLQRISQVAPLSSTNVSALDFSYVYDSSAGRGVDIYIVDTGVIVEHHDFEGRARWGAVFGGYPQGDGRGHGTHVAGTAAGRRFGVAKAANIVAVRVLDDTGNGRDVAGVDWVISEVARTGRPSVINVSLWFFPSDALDAALTAAVNAGIHVAVAAGNFEDEADQYSPSRAPALITVGATTINDAMAQFSNYGAVVDILAPGEDVISALSTNLDGYTSLSGTSMASPHVAGIVAYLIALEGNKSPAQLLARIKQFSPDGILKSVRKYLCVQSQPQTDGLA
ncbi:peptidase 1 [Auricularia subglabra TFB-10046 SS5]|nr:peptidase 1 [Auricularia subglabra TFB-10046 SS5]